MRTIPLVAIAFAALSLSSIRARADGTWCAHYSSPGGGTNCGFYSFAQCQAMVSGIDDFASAIHSHRIPTNRDGAIAVTVKKQKC